MTIRELVENVQSFYSKGIYSDDARLSNRHIYSLAKATREKLFVQKVNKKQILSSYEYTTLNCLEVIRVPVHDCPCVPPVGCSILRTKEKLPRPLKSYSRELIDYVGFGNREFSFITEQASAFLKGEKYPSDRYFLKDGYIFLVTKKPIKVISVRGIFSDVEEVNKLENLCGCNNPEDNNKCKSILDTEFNASNEMTLDIIEIVKETLLKMFVSFPEDVTNNSIDGPKENSK